MNVRANFVGARRREAASRNHECNAYKRRTPEGCERPEAPTSRAFKRNNCRGSARPQADGRRRPRSARERRPKGTHGPIPGAASANSQKRAAADGSLITILSPHLWIKDLGRERRLRVVGRRLVAHGDVHQRRVDGGVR